MYCTWTWNTYSMERKHEGYNTLGRSMKNYRLGYFQVWNILDLDILHDGRYLGNGYAWGRFYKYRKMYKIFED